MVSTSRSAICISIVLAPPVDNVHVILPSTEGLQSSPVQRLIGRRTKTRLPTTTSLLRPEIHDESEAIKRQKLKQAHYYNQGSKDLQQLKPTQIVRIQPNGQHKTWRKAMMTKQVGIRSYEVETEGGTYLRQNRRKLRTTTEDHNTSTVDPPVTRKQSDAVIKSISTIESTIAQPRQQLQQKAYHHQQRRNNQTS